MPDPSPTRGRPRDAGRDVAILDATLRLLTEVGYDQLSIEAVATHAEVGKPTVYRRYPSKAALVAAAVERRAVHTPPVNWTGDLREVLLGIVRWLAGQIAAQEVGLLGAMFAGMRSDPELAAAMRRILRRDQEMMTGEPFRAAIEDGEPLSPRAAELFAEIAPALIVHRLIITGEPCDESFLEHLVDDILIPLLHGKPAT